MDKLPIYNLEISEDDTNDSGVIAVALVDSPAIQINWRAFNSQKQLFQTTNNEKRIVSGALMVADLPIYRKDERGEYYVKFDKENIYKIVKKYFRNHATSNVNLMHDQNAQVDGVYMFESFIIDKERGISTPKGYDELPDGSWFGSFKVDNPKVWDEFIKTGVFKGFSVEGFFQERPTDALTESEIKELEKAIK